MLGSKAPNNDANGLFRATHPPQSYPLFAYHGAYAPLLCSYRGRSQGHSTTSVQAHVGLDLLPLTSFIINSIERKERQQLQWRIFSREMHSGLVETNL